MNPQTLDKVKTILRRDLKLGPDAVIPDDMPFFGGDFDLDSLDVLLLLSSIEKEFGIKIPSEQVGKAIFANVTTLTQFIDESRKTVAPAAAPAAAAPVDLLSQLPHRDPFRFVSRVLDVKAGDNGQAVWSVTGKEAFFAGHFPGNPIVPGVLIAEALAQVSGLVGHTEGQTGGKLAQVDVRFDQPVAPPADILLRSRLLRTLDKLQLFDVTASVGQSVIARGTITLART